MSLLIDLVKWCLKDIKICKVKLVLVLSDDGWEDRIWNIRVVK